MQRALSSLPPGFQFFPSEEILLNYYLINKNQGQDFDGANLITELELFEYDPFDLPDSASFAYDHRGRKRHWYYFTERDMHRNKVTMSGFWLRDGRVRIPSSGAGNVVLGTRTSFIFHTGKSIKNVARTNWTLYEYALADHQAPFVLCRVFRKPRKNSSLEIALSSETGSSVRHIGIQHDGGVEYNVDNDGAPTDVNEVENVPIPGFPHDSPQERVSGLGMRDAWFDEAMTSEEIARCIQEEDFIELNDLLD